MGVVPSFSLGVGSPPKSGRKPSRVAQSKGVNVPRSALQDNAAPAAGFSGAGASLMGNFNRAAGTQAVPVTGAAPISNFAASAPSTTVFGGSTSFAAGAPAAAPIFNAALPKQPVFVFQPNVQPAQPASAAHAPFFAPATAAAQAQPGPGLTSPTSSAPAFGGFALGETIYSCRT